jgi:hypothetical protein
MKAAPCRCCTSVLYDSGAAHHRRHAELRHR